MPQPKSRQDHQPGRHREIEKTRPNPHSLPGTNLSEAHLRTRLRIGSKQKVHTQLLSPTSGSGRFGRRIWIKMKMSLSLDAVIAGGREKNSGNDHKAIAGARTCILQCTGGLSARVALLQSPILPAAELFYTKKQSFRGLPI